MNSSTQDRVVAPGLKSKVSHNIAKFAVVSNPGTIFQQIEDYCSTIQGARDCQSCYDEPTDIMLILPDGTLTTEF